MANSQSKHLQEPMNFPKRTQEVATILCHNQLLDGDTELSRKIVGLLKGAETEWQRAWHIHRLRHWHGSFLGLRRCFSEYQYPNYPCRSDFSFSSLGVGSEINLPRQLMMKELVGVLEARAHVWWWRY
jgi:hypothetical protein